MRKLCCGLLVLSSVLFIDLTPAVAGFVVSGTPLPMADQTTYPNGVSPVVVSFQDTALEDFTMDFSGSNFSYDGQTHSITVENSANPLNVKHVWFEMGINPEAIHGMNPPFPNVALPQNAGAQFNAALWPQLTDPNVGVTVTGAAVLPDSNGFTSIIQMTWDIFPQPDSETISLDFPGLNGNFDEILWVQVKTICENPVPEPSTFALLTIGGLVLVGYGWRRKRVQAA